MTAGIKTISDMAIDELYSEVSRAIWEAEGASDPYGPEAKSAFAEVSLLEEAIAERLPADDFEGMIARRGAVRAAVSAGDLIRARQLAQLYREDPKANESFKRSLLELLLPVPVEGVTAPIAVDLDEENKVIAIPGAPNIPHIGSGKKQLEHDQLLDECVMVAERILSLLKKVESSVRSDYRACFESYHAALPTEPGKGNMLIADSEARVIRGLFEADQNILPAAFAERLTGFFLAHQSFCVYYEGVERFYEDVHRARLSLPLPEQSVAAFVDAIELSPDVFDSQVVRQLRDIDHELTSQEIIAIRAESSGVAVPADPLARRPARARTFGVASAINVTYSTFLAAWKSVEFTRPSEKLGEELGEKVAPVLALLRDLERPSQYFRY